MADIDSEPKKRQNEADDAKHGNITADKAQNECKTAAEYANAVNLWMQQCLQMQWMAASMPYFINYTMLAHYAASQDFARLGALRRPIRTPPITLFGHFTRQLRNAIRVQRLPARGLQNSAASQSDDHRGREFKIPRLWKRFTAEFIDFTILLLLKLFVTFVILDFFNIVSDLQKYDLETLQAKVLDYKVALQVTSEIFFLELIHRTVVCVFEALCIHKGTVGVGGATPGKSLLGLRVVSCESIEVLPGNRRILVWPAGDLGFGWALLRAIIKNFSMAFFLPTCFTLFFVPYNRTVYDILCKSIVVEDIRPPPRWN